MPEAAVASLFLKDLFPTAGDDLLGLLAQAADNATLLSSDFYTMRDWLDLTGYDGCDSVYLLLLVLLAALDEGSYCVECSEATLTRRLADLIDAEPAPAWAGRIVGDLDAGCYADLVGHAAADHRPIILHAAAGRRFFYFQKYLRAELHFRAALESRLQSAALPVDRARLSAVLREVLVEQPLPGPAGSPLSLDREQRWALEMALLRNVAIVSGGPGTGKTSIVLTLLRCLIRTGIAPERIALAAPTGRAAQRLGDALRAGLARLPADGIDMRLRDLSASTLHQLLGYRPSRNLFARHRENPIPADVVVIDEVSMVGLVLMAQLLGALAPGTRLILLGDKDQLPSVDAGAVLANLVPDGRATAFGPDLCATMHALDPDNAPPRAAAPGPLSDHVVVLQTNHRSQAEIRDAAGAINRQDLARVEALPAVPFVKDDPAAWVADLEQRGGCWRLEPSHASAAELRGILHHWAEHAYFGTRLDGETLAERVRQLEAFATLDAVPPDRLLALFALLDRFRLLTLVREGPWGCVEINRFLDASLRPRLDADADADARGGLFAGAPVLVTRNDAVHGLFNGDVGLAVRLADGALRVVFPRPGSFVALPAEALPAHERGFALTVHKSQGSEYANVLVVLPPEGGRRLLTKELIYTAITRAKALAVVYATRDVLRLAVGRAIARESVLAHDFAEGDIRTPSSAHP